ncbi:integral membrane protein [Colletotrichum incanum]|uniref:Integral membrane protein n=1 Tax=Colletotrichum incanum TaxID=1573173 RepID=A0A161VR44_COLIC|nr:integral membrane protein [Colletotrichum incanum]
MSSPTSLAGAAPPPPGQTPNFDHPQDERYTIHMTFMILAQVVVTTFLLIHVYVKLLGVKSFRLEDLHCLILWFDANVLTLWIELHFGEGFHIWEIRASSYTELQKSFYVGTIVFSPAAFFTKAAILLLVVRIFAVERTTARILYTILAFFLICHIIAQLAKTLVCIPIQANWDPTVPNVRCINQTKVFAYDTSLGIISDLTILAVPIILMWKLQIPGYRKAKFVGILSAGGVAVAVTICRLALLFRFQNTTDPTVDFVTIDWTAISTGEVTIGLVCAAFPSINYLLKQRTVNKVPPNIPRTTSSRWAKVLRQVKKDGVSHQHPDCDIELACINELRETLELYQETSIVPVLDIEFLQQVAKNLESTGPHIQTSTPGTEGIAVNFIDPSLYALSYGRSKALLEEEINLQICFEYIGKRQLILKSPRSSRMADVDMGESTAMCLPCNVQFPDGDNAKITIYVNELHLRYHADLYPLLEKVITKTIPLWNLVCSTLYESTISCSMLNYYPEAGRTYPIGKTSPWDPLGLKDDLYNGAVDDNEWQRRTYE